MSTYDILMFIFSGICAIGTVFAVVDTLVKNHKENKKKDTKNNRPDSGKVWRLFLPNTFREG